MRFIWAWPWLFACVASDDACEHDAHGLIQLAKVGPETWTSERDLATIYEREPMTWGSFTLSFYSAVPTFGPDGNYIALLHHYEDGLWNHSQKHAMYCSGASGEHRSRVRVKGGEHRDIGGHHDHKFTMVFLCDWPDGGKNEHAFEASRMRFYDVLCISRRPTLCVAQDYLEKVTLSCTSGRPRRC